MTGRRAAPGLLGLLALGASALAASAPAPVRYGGLPLGFEENGGQLAPEVRFAARSQGVSALFTAEGPVLLVRGAPGPVRMRLESGSFSAPVGGEPLPGRVNVFTGADPSRWRANLRAFRSVRYRQVYPGIDLVFHGEQSRLEYDFVLAPGARADRIRVRFQGARVRPGRDGALRVAGELLQQAPVAYQEIGGERRPVRARHRVLADGSVGFTVPRYDRRAPLVIDPVLVYSTFLGGGGQERPIGISVDVLGNAYVTGSTASTDFPTTSALQATNAGLDDVYVAKINAAGSALVYSTYLGGGGEEIGRDLAVDRAGNVHVVGYTDSPDFPRVSALQAAYAGGPYDGFAFKLNPSGSALVYSTYLGGSGEDLTNGIALDGDGNAYLAGATDSPDFPRVGAFQATLGGGPYDAYVAKLNAAGTALVYASYLGGLGEDVAREIAVDPSGNAYAVGYTSSADFPTRNPVQPEVAGGYDAFLTKVNAAGTALVYSTYLGAGGYDQANDVTVDPTGVPMVAGYTDSALFPRVNPFQPSYGGDPFDGFITRYNQAGSQLTWSTFLGGFGEDGIRGVSVEPSGAVFVGGYTSAANFPVTADGFQRTNAGGFDSFIAHLGADGTTLIFSSYLGGGGGDFGRSLATDGSANAYVVGETGSTNFPVSTGAFQGTYGGGLDGYLAKIGTTAPAITAINPASGPVTGGTTVTITGTNFAAGSTTLTIGGTGVTPTVLSTTTLTATTPPHGAGAVDVVVTRPSLPPATLAGGFTYALTPQPAPPPTVTRITPPAGSSLGGTHFTITGTNFAPGAAITVGGAAAINVSFVSPTTLTGDTPAHAPGTTDVVVTNPDTQSAMLAQAFTFVGPPEVTRIQPATGPVAGGTAVTITGTGFAAGVAVTLGGFPLQTPSFVSPTTITGTTPPHGAGAVDVQATNPDGQKGQLAGGFTYLAPLPPPTVTGITPASGPLAGGTSITVTGTGFVVGATVTLGGAPAVGVTVQSATQLTATTFRRGAPGTVDVVIANPDGQSGTLPDAFTYDPPPTGYAGWGCGCSSGGAPLAGVAILLLSALRRRRRALGGAAALLVACAGLSARAEDGPPPPALVHVTAAGFGEFIARHGGAELGASAGLGHWVDLGLAATLGPQVGGRLTVGLHPPRPAAGLSPFLQLRGVLHPVPQGLGLGAGAWIGGAYEAGPGRVIFGFGGEYIAGPPQYIPYGIWFVGGYQFDLVRPDRAAGASALATLRGRVVDLDDKPVGGAVATFPGSPAPLGEKQLDASPSFEVRLPPGEHTAEIRAPGYLVRGRSLTVRPGETLVVDFTLRPEPAQRQAQLTDTQIEIRQMIQFAFNEARLLRESFPILDEVTDILLEHKALRIRIEGHTDDQGGPEFNRKLSQARAEAVRAYLIDWGVEPERLVAEGYGLTRPITTNATEVGRAVNRRVQFTVLGR